MDVPEIPGYRIQDELGRGARGVVYRARRGDVNYAVKVQSDLEDRSLLSYGAILACIRHPGLPEVFEVGEVGGRPYLVREYVPGYTLAAELETGPLEEARLVEIAKTLAGALDQVHRHGLIHRDVKPANVLLARSGGARLIDFGFATRIHASRDETVGTYLYSAPEQTGMLDAPMDQRTDLYALGAVLFRCAAGRAPYESENTAELLRMHASAPVPRVRDVNPDLSPALAMMIEKLLSKDPRDRYQTGRSLLADLRALGKLNARLEAGETVVLGESGKELANETAAMVGREAELEELTAALERTLAGSGTSALIEGEGGCGKSLLAREFLRRGLQFRPLVLEARCEKGQAPFASIKGWIESYFACLPEFPAVQRRHVETQLRAFGAELGLFLGKLGPAAAEFFGVEAAVTDPETSDQFMDAAASFFLELSRLHGCAVLVTDDAHQLDEAGHQVVRRLRLNLHEAPVFLLATARSSPESRQGLELYVRSAAPELRLALESLGKPEVELLVYSLLGSRPVNPELVQQVAVRSHGNPFAATEYVRAMLSSGVVLPTLEGWRVDHQALQNLQLPDDVLELVLQRVGLLDPPVFSLLTTAAVFGNRFSVEVLAAVEGYPRSQVEDYLETAVRSNIVEFRPPATYLFVHDRIREAFLSELEADRERRRLLHRRVATGLEKLVGEQPDLAYAVARHYASADGHSPQVYETSLSAGLMALRDYAFEDAYAFLKQASESTRQDAPSWMEPLSVACERTGRVEEAVALLERLLAGRPEPLRRAQYLGRLSKLNHSKLDRAQALEGCRQALSAVGKPVLDHPAWNAMAAVYCFGRWLLAQGSGVGAGKARGDDRERLKTLAELYQSYSEAEYFEMHYPKMLEMGARACLAGHRLGPSPQLITSYSNMMVFFGMLRRKELVERWAGRIEKQARALGDPVSLSHFQVMRHVALHIAGLSEEVDEGLGRTLSQKGHLMESWVYLIGVADLAWSLFMRGYVQKAWNWVQRGVDRCKLTSSPAGVARDLDILSCYAISCLAALGRPGEALDNVERLKQRCAAGQADRSLAANYFGHLLALHLESQELGQPMQETGEAFLRIGLVPALAPLHRRHFYVLWAYCWLGRCLRPEAPASDVARLDEALKLLSKAANRPVLRCHYLAILGGRQHLAGEHQKALATLSAAQDLADLNDMPWVTHEVAKQRARILTKLGKFDVAAREAGRAYHLAVEFGWPSRARSVASEFSLGRSAASRGSTSVGSMGPRKTNPEETIQVRLERQLEALLNLSVASAQVLSPFEQARVALDELIGLLSAERAYLFMLGDQGLNFVTGRNREGETLSAPSGYSRTVIETVYFSREPVVIAGTEQGEALGSESVVAHDLRSIICTPLRIRDRFVGVVYLDNRLARGVFTAEDIQILNALSSHIAVAMETARAARLEVEVEAERRRRELADVLSQFTATLSSTLDAEKILGQLLETLARSVKFVRASVWLGQGELKLVAHRGYPESNHPTPVIDPRSISGMAQALETSRPVWESCLTREPGLETLAWSEPFSWMVLPLLSDRRVGGIVTLSASGAESYSEYDVEVAFTFCNQAGIALANASLFDEINRLATTDSLTGLYNRRRFFQLSEMELERAARYGRRDISAIMIDVDHFKRFNDSYGHAAGDEVLRRVARICKEQLGEDGILGRLGGEEFAVLVRADARKAQEAYAEPMRTAVEAAGVDFEGQRLNVTLSLGVASLEPDEVLDQLLSRADEALYEAKNSGRNRVRASVRV